MQTLGASFLGVILASAVLWFFAAFVPEKRTAAIDGWRAALSVRADVRRDVIDRIIKGDLSDVQMLASLPDARAMFSGALAAREAEACRGRMREVLKLFVAGHGASGAALQDAAGGLIVSAGRPPPASPGVGVEAAAPRGCREMVDFVHDENGRPLLVYTSPIVMRPDLEPSGCAAVAVDPEDMYAVLGAQVAPGATSEAVLVQRGGDAIVFLSPLAHRPGAPLTFRLLAAQANIASRMALAGKEDFGSFLDYRGARVFAAVRRVKNASWGLVVKIDEDEALAAFRKDVLQKGVTWGALLLALGAASAGLWRSLVVSSETELARIEAREAAVVRGLNADLEERVRQRTADLEAANKELEAFSYSVSHDLRSPLRAVDGFSRILLEDHAPRLDAEGKRLLDVVRSNTLRMGQLIDDLLSFSRVNRQGMARTAVDMRALADEAFRSSVDADEAISFTVGPLPEADVDPPLMRQVWVNLISNALKFTRPKAERVIGVEGRTEAGRLVYSVKDNGVGFDMAYVDKLFGVFQRLHSTQEFEGTGVGLALVQRIVHRHGGDVWAEGKVGEGAVFSFSLPRPGGSS